MRDVQEKAYAKLNLSLDVTARRDDGFHELAMLMQTVSVCDELTLSLNDTQTVSASCSLHFIPTDERNLVYAIVNTLCQLESVSGVRFYIEGLSAETLAGNIYLRSVLLPNPGIIAGSENEPPAATASP